MKIVDIAVRKVYRFNCPNCQSRLEAEAQELVDIGGKVLWHRYHTYRNHLYNPF